MNRSTTTLQRLVHRVAEESQLLAEEKWIIDTLNQIKKQRNGLQIERLQLESMKNQMTLLRNKTSRDDPLLITDKEPTVVTVNTTQNVFEVNPSEPPTSEEQFREAEALCNKEELDLNVTNSIFNKITVADINVEEDEEDEEEDNYEDLMIDMNMFMHGMQDIQSKSEK